MLSKVAPAPTQMNGFLLIIITTAETRPRSFPLYEKKHDRGVDTQREEGACCTASLSTVLVQCTLPLHAVSSGVVPAPSSLLKPCAAPFLTANTSSPCASRDIPHYDPEQEREGPYNNSSSACPCTTSFSPSQQTHGTTICNK